MAKHSDSYDHVNCWIVPYEGATWQNSYGPVIRLDTTAHAAAFGFSVKDGAKRYKLRVIYTSGWTGGTISMNVWAVRTKTDQSTQITDIDDDSAWPKPSTANMAQKWESSWITLDGVNASVSGKIRENATLSDFFIKAIEVIFDREGD